ncbi:MAG TPA: carboxypeptidase regulatory-like domain-containing protein, partial [Planctomycetota bacterium]|nr:carboxypeptidase regulatory-like domain-containing protein [Planctomycetota bacterium]
MTHRRLAALLVLATLATALLLATLLRTDEAPGRAQPDEPAHADRAGSEAGAAQDAGTASALPGTLAGPVTPLLEDGGPAGQTRVEPRRWVSGRVVRASDGTPIVGAAVRAPPSGQTTGGITEAPDGRFRIWPRETAGHLEVSLSRTQFWPPAPQSYPIEPGAADIEDLELVYDSGFSVEGRVLDQGGRPVRHASVLLGPASGAGSDGFATDSSGRFLIRDLAPPPELGSLTLAATKAGYLPSQLELPVPTGTARVLTVDLTLQLGGTIEVVVRLPSGAVP